MCFIVIFFFTILSSTPCNLTSFYINQTVYLADVITDCLKTIPADEVELNSFIDIAIEFYRNCPYQILFANAPNGISSFDLVAELKDLKSKISNYNSGQYLEFYEKFYKTVLKFRDFHALAYTSLPFLSYFSYALPCWITPVIGSDFYHFKLIPNEFTDLTMDKFNISDYDNIEITEIDITDGGSKYLPAAEAISNIAISEGCSGYDPHANFNAYVQYGPFPWDLGFMFMSRYNSRIFMRGKDESGSTVEFYIPWLGMYLDPEPDKHPDFNSLNPLIPLPITPPTPNTIASSIRSHPITNHIIGRDSVFLPRVLRRQHRIRNNHSSSPGYVSTRVQSAYEEMLQRRKLISTTPDSGIGTGTDVGTGTIVISSVDKDMAGSFKDEVNVELGMGTVREAGVEKEAKKETEKVTAAGGLELLYTFVDPNRDPDKGPTAPVVIAQIFQDTFRKIGYMKYIAFYCANETDEFLKGVATSFQTMVGNGIENMILDVRGNTGGEPVVLQTLLDFFFHDSIYPVDMVMDTLNTPLNIQFAKSLSANSFINYNVESGEIIPDFYKDLVTKQHVNAVTTPPTYIKAEYTRRTASRVLSAYSETLPVAFGGFSPFDPQHFYVLTDGVCYSACSIFTRQVLETRAARVLGYGWNPRFEGSFGSYAPGSCAGFGFGTPTVEMLRNTQGTDKDSLPPQLPREGESLGFTTMELFSRNPLHNDTLYFGNTSVQEVMPFHVVSGVDDINRFNDIAAAVHELYIAPLYCFPGEVRVDSACEVSHPELHMLWGRPCETKDGKRAFSTDQCAFASCAPGFFLSDMLDGVGVCLPIPTVHDADSHAHSDVENARPLPLPLWAIVLISVVGGAVVMAVILGLIMWCCLKRNSSDQYSKLGVN